MEILLGIASVILAIYIVVAYVLEAIVFASIVKDNGGIDQEDLMNWEFWLVVVCVLTAPVSMPISIAVDYLLSKKTP